MSPRHPTTRNQNGSNLHSWAGIIILLLLALTIRWARNPSPSVGTGSPAVQPAGTIQTPLVSVPQTNPQVSVPPIQVGIPQVTPLRGASPNGWTQPQVTYQPPQPAAVSPLPVVGQSQVPSTSPAPSVNRVLPPFWKMAANSPPVNAISIDPRGTAWAATEDGLVQVENGKVNYLTRSNGLFPAISATCLAHDGNSLWIGTYEGLFQTTDGRSFRRFQKSAGLAHDMIWSLDWDGRILWVGTQEGFSFISPDGKVEKVDKKISNGGLADLWIGSIRRFDRWALCGNDDGLSIWDTANVAANPAAWITLDMFSTNLAHNWILSLAVANGKIWAGTPSGLCMLETQIEKLFTGVTANWRIFSARDGLPSDRIDAITPLGDDLWVGTPGGLTRIRNGGTRNLFYSDGLLATDVRALNAASDTLWVGTSGGIQALNIPALN